MKIIIWIRYLITVTPIMMECLDNPGSILYYKPTRTGQKSNHNIGWGISATISIPLDKTS